MVPALAWAGAAAPPGAMLAPARLRQVALLGDPRFRHAGSITHVIPLPDGKRVLTTARDGSARLWDAASGAELRRYRLPSGDDVWHAALLPGGREFLTAGEGNGVLRWSLDAASPLHTYKQDAIVFRLAADKAGRQFATADYKKRAILLDVKTGKEVRCFAGHKKSVYTVLFTRDGKKLITGSGDETIRFWDVASGEEQRQVKNETGDVYTMAWNPQQTRILVCCEKKSAWLMDAGSGKEIWQAGLPDGVYCGAWSPGGTHVAVVCQDDRLYFLDAATGRRRWSVALPAEANYGVAFSADGKEVLCASDRLLCRFDTRTGARVYPEPDSPAQNTPVASVALMPKTRAVLRVDGSPGVRLLDGDTGAPRGVWLAKEDVGAVAVSADSSKVLVGGGKSDTWLLDAKTGKPLRRLPHQRVCAAAFSGDGSLAVTASRSSGERPAVVIWRVEDGKALSSFAGPGTIGGISVDPEGRPVMAVCGNKGLQIRSFATGDLLREISLQDRDPSACALAPSAEQSLLVREKSALVLWTSPAAKSLPLTDAGVRRLVDQLGADQYRTREKATERLIQGGDRVLVALAKVTTRDAEVRIRLAHIQQAILNSANAYQQRDQVPLAEGGSTSLSLHPDGRHWAALEGACSKAGIVIGRIDAGKLKVLRRIAEPHVPWVLLFGRDGRLYVGNRNGTISVYAAGP